MTETEALTKPPPPPKGGPKTEQDEYDSPWKDVIPVYLKPFMSFFFPEIHNDIDWSHSFTNLETELRKLARESETGKNTADVLLKVRRLNGTEQYVLIHIEIQSQYDSGFAKRVYRYNYRAFDRYDQDVVSLAILADENPNWCPKRYARNLWGCLTGIRFPVAKLWHYNQRWTELETNTNPFAVVVMAHLKTLATRHDPEARFYWKRNLVRRLYKDGYEREDVLRLLRFIDWVMALPKELAEQFEEEHQRLEEEVKMRYVTTWERKGREKGRQEGEQKGRQEGEQKGRQEGEKKGKQEGAASLLERMLTLRFKELPAWVEQRLRKASLEELEGWGERLLEAKRLEDVFVSA